jgi:hypothetical protein
MKRTYMGMLVGASIDNMSISSAVLALPFQDPVLVFLRH